MQKAITADNNISGLKNIFFKYETKITKRIIFKISPDIAQKGNSANNTIHDCIMLYTPSEIMIGKWRKSEFEKKLDLKKSYS